MAEIGVKRAAIAPAEPVVMGPAFAGVTTEK
jgi:hypothetical protein